MSFSSLFGRKRHEKKKFKPNRQGPSIKTDGEQAVQSAVDTPVQAISSSPDQVLSAPQAEEINRIDARGPSSCVFEIDVSGETPPRQIHQDVQVDGEVSVTSAPVGDNSGRSITADVPASTSHLRLIFMDALEKYTQRTNKDLTKQPLVAKLQRCNTVNSVMDVLEECTSEFVRFRNGTAKVQLMRRLKPIVNVLVALRLDRTVGEGIGTIFGPGKAVIGAICILLEAVHDVSESYDSLMELFECISSFLVRLEVYSKHTISSEMKGVLIKVLVEVLSIFGLATEQISQGRFQKYAKTLLGDSDIENAFKILSRLTSDEAQMVGAEILNVIYDVVSSLNMLMQGGKVSIAAIRTDLGDLRTSMGRLERDVGEIKHGNIIRDFRSWLLPPDPSTNHVAALNSRHEGTASWLTEGEVIQDWKRSGSLLWVHGKPGAGKTVICSAIIEELRCYCLLLPNSILTYFYCDFRESAKQDVRGLLCHLLTSISAESSACNQILFALYSSHGRGSRGPSNADLHYCLEEMLRALPDRSIYIVVDALDECPNTPFESPRKRMLRLIQDLLGLRLPNLHVCINSRPEPDIAEYLQPLGPQSVAIDKEIGQARDMTDYVRSSIDGDIGFRSWSLAHKIVVVKALSQQANGMFRWVTCQLDVLRRCPPSRIESVLHSLPKTLDETYDRILNTISDGEAEHLLRIFQYLTVSVCPLQVDELAEALAVDVESDIPKLIVEWRYENPEVAVLDLCSTLIAIHPVTKEVQFAHFSVQEYLLAGRLASKPNKSINRFHISERDAHSTLAKACLGILLQLSTHGDGRDTTADKVQKSPLLNYAARHWMTHTSIECVSEIIDKAMECFFSPDNQCIGSWIQIFNPDILHGMHEQNRTALYYAALYGFEHVVKHILALMASDRVGRNIDCGMALFAAVYQGHTGIFHLLLKYGADANTSAGRHGTTLGEASAEGRVEIARLLIKHGADVNGSAGLRYKNDVGSKSSDGRVRVTRLLVDDSKDIPIRARDYCTALEVASENGHVKIVHLLLEHGADTNAVAGDNVTALKAASENGHIEIARLLVKHGANVNASTGDHRTALEAASANGHVDIVHLLIEHDADVNTGTDGHGTALQAASANGHVKIASLLIEHRADVNAPAGNYGTALEAASARGHIKIVYLLLEHEADVNATTDDYRTALGAASKRGDIEIARVLIEHGADVNSSADRRTTALGVASEEGHIEVARLLLKHRANVNAPTGNYRTALGVASMRAPAEIVHLLVEHGADINAATGDHSTALGLASWRGHFEIARLLVEHGADVNGLAGQYETALGVASDHGHIEIARLLINNGAHVDAAAGRHKTALGAASARGYFKIAHLLVEHGADVNTAAGEYGTAVEAASKNGHVKIIRLLLEHGADISGQAGIMLREASAKGYLEIARLLLEYGADNSINAAADDGSTALGAASENGHTELAHLLVEYGANVNGLGSWRMTALQSASDNGHIEIARLLLEAGADINGKVGWHTTALREASRNGHIEIARLLVEHGANVNDAAAGYYGTALEAASAAGRIEVVRLLIEHGADINAVVGIKGTALGAASISDHINIARLLVKHGADINSVAGDYGTALGAASVNNHIGIARLLIEQGADINAEAGRYGALLKAASVRGHLEIAHLLIEHNADVNAVDWDGWTALGGASARGRVAIVRLLVEHGADIDGVAGNYGTALKAAQEQGHDEIVQLLVEYSADASGLDNDHDSSIAR